MWGRSLSLRSASHNPLRHAAAAVAAASASPGSKSVARSAGRLQLPPTQLSRLSNGVRVASQSQPGTWANITVLFRGGARYESAGYYGASHFMDKLAFKANDRHTAREVVTELEKIGGDVSSITNRESFMYSANVLLKDADTAVHLMADSALRPKYLEEEIEEVKASLKAPSALAKDRPDVIANEAVHEAAFGRHTYGHRTICSPAVGASLTRDTIFDFHRRILQPQHTVVSGVGIEHEDLVKLAERHFGEHVFPKNAHSPFSIEDPKYVGGEVAIPSDTPLVQAALGTPLTYVVVGLKAPIWPSRESFAASVLQSLLGGGNSFSVGGPGKGMFSWFYTQILNMYYFIDLAAAVHQSYNDTGLFMLQLAAPEDKCKLALSVMVRAMVLAAVDVSAEELLRAKNQLKANILQHLESRAICAEDIARQVLVTNDRMSPAALCEAIDAVTVDDLKRQVVTLLHSKPAVGVCGSKNVPITSDKLHSMILTTLDQHNLWEYLRKL